MIMKIFADNSGSTGDDIILAGLDDAVKLGADAVNLSLGSPPALPSTAMRTRRRRTAISPIPACIPGRRRPASM